jgi:MraZ protein
LDFTGTFDHNLDAKHRLTVPSKFRSALAGKVFLVTGPDPCISVYPEATYTHLTATALAGLNPFAPEARELKRVLFGGASDVELDGAGRVMIPPRYLQHAGITGREVMVTGAGDSLELWDRDRWETYYADLKGRATDLTASLGHPA